MERMIHFITLLGLMDNYIFRKKKCLTKDSCKSIITFFEKSNEKVENPRGYIGIYTTFDNSQLMFLLDIVRKSINEYSDKYDYLKRLYTDWGVTHNFHVQKYLPGNSYSGEHMEHGKDECDSKRLLGWMFYLNDIKKDGGTCWPQQNFTTKPREGDLYIWPAGWTHSHHGIPAPNEIKYIVTGWVEMYG